MRRKKLITNFGDSKKLYFLKQKICDIPYTKLKILFALRLKISHIESNPCIHLMPEVFIINEETIHERIR